MARALTFQVLAFLLALKSAESFLVEKPIDCSNVCLSKECVAAAARMNSFIDYSVSPCDDFYQFACGRFLKETVLPSDQTSVNSFSTLDDKTSLKVKNLLEGTIEPTDPRSFLKAQDFYASCMDLDAIDERGNEPIQRVLKEIFGGFPLVDPNWTDDNFDVTDVLVQLTDYGSNPFTNLWVLPNSKNYSSHIAALTWPSFLLRSFSNYIGSKAKPKLDALEKAIWGTARALGVPDEDSTKKQVTEMVDFAIALANATDTNEYKDIYSLGLKPYTLDEVHANYSGVIDWKKFYLTIFSRPEVGVIDSVDGNEKFDIISKGYFRNMQELLKETPKRVIANHMAFQFIMRHMRSLGSQFRQVYSEFQAVISGRKSDPPRFINCVAVASAYLPHLVGRMFIDDYFPSSSKDAALDMITRIKEAMDNAIKNSPWLDDATKAAAIEKDAYIKSNIGYAEVIKNDTFLDTYYSDYTFNTSTYLENRLLAQKNFMTSIMKELPIPLSETLDLDPATTVNAFYSPEENAITFPAGILQPPFFQSGLPMYMNFGGIGTVVAHEIGHAFDDTGREYDKDGYPVSWWPEDTVDIYINRTQCYVQQYSNFTIVIDGEEYNLDGELTLGEDIADDQGLKLGHKAYTAWLDSQHGRGEQLLPGLEFNQDQLFFLSFGQTECNKQTNERSLNQLENDVHSLSPFRIIGTVQNYEGFAKAFNCPVGSKMNPENKCSLWG